MVPATRMGLAGSHERAGGGDEAGGGIGFPRVGDVEHLVRELGPCRGAWFGGANIHAAVDLHGVDGHDGWGSGAAGGLGEAKGEGFGEVALAGGGAAENDNRFGHVSTIRGPARGVIWLRKGVALRHR